MIKIATYLPIIIITTAFLVFFINQSQKCSDRGGVLVRGVFWYVCAGAK